MSPLLPCILSRAHISRVQGAEIARDWPATLRNFSTADGDTRLTDLRGSRVTVQASGHQLSQVWVRGRFGWLQLRRRYREQPGRHLLFPPSISSRLLIHVSISTKHICSMFYSKGTHWSVTTIRRDCDILRSTDNRHSIPSDRQIAGLDQHSLTGHNHPLQHPWQAYVLSQLIYSPTSVQQCRKATRNSVTTTTEYQ